jgi:hypothetical protein
MTFGQFSPPWSWCTARHAAVRGHDPAQAGALPGMRHGVGCQVTACEQLFQAVASYSSVKPPKIG